MLVMFELCESHKKLIEGTLPVSFILKGDFGSSVDGSVWVQYSEHM